MTVFIINAIVFCLQMVLRGVGLGDLHVWGYALPLCADREPFPAAARRPQDGATAMQHYRNVCYFIDYAESRLDLTVLMVDGMSS